MQAITIPSPGGPEALVLAECPDPEPAAGEVRISVAAAGVNRADVMQRKGFYPPPPGASAYPGLEVSGTIDALGEGVSGWQVGDEVCALLSGGGYADLVCVLLDARAGLDEEAEAIFAKLDAVKHPKFLVINKVDLVAREKLLALAQKANELLHFDKTFMISAISGDGVDDLRHALAQAVPECPFHYPEDQMSDAPLRHLAAEITREKIYRHLHQELPYQSTVETDSWKEQNNKSVRIEQTIFVERESQRKIVLGKGGATIKAIGADSRKEIAEIVGVPVHLFLFVKVRDNWSDDPERYREMGLEFPNE